MGIRNIRKDDDEILRKRSKEVDIIDDKVRELIKDMMDTMHKFDGFDGVSLKIEILKRTVWISGIKILLNRHISVGRDSGFM